jgi:hypothetical protein
MTWFALQACPTALLPLPRGPGDEDIPDFGRE